MTLDDLRALSRSHAILAKGRVMNLLLILSVIVATSECYKILCLLPYSGKSHHMVFEPILQELTHRGHNITTVSFFPASNPHPNRRDVSLVGLADLNIEVVDLSTIDDNSFGLDFLAHLSMVKGLAKYNLALCEKLIYADVFKEFVEGKGEYDVVLVEHFNSDCMLGLIYNYGLPSVGLSSCAALPWTPSRLGAPDNPSYVPGMTLPFTDDMTFVQRLQNTIIHYYYQWWFEIAIRWEEQKLLETRLGRKLPPLSEIGANASVFLVNTHHTLNGVRVMPPSFVEIGGIHLHNKTVKPLPKDLEKWIGGAKDGFIIFSLGSLIRGSTLPPQRLNAIVKVFAGLSQHVLWKWESEHIDNLTPNVRVMKWLPQYDLLQHPNCVGLITHSGLLSLTEAVYAGVPTVGVAVLGDQFGNAAHAQRAGVSRMLLFNEVDEASFGDAVREMLTKEKRVEAKLLSQKWRDRPLSPMDTAVFYIEQTARFGGLHLSSHARNLTTIQRNLVDVVAFIACVLVAIITSMTFVCKCRGGEKKVKLD